MRPPAPATMQPFDPMMPRVNLFFRCTVLLCTTALIAVMIASFFLPYLSVPGSSRTPRYYRGFLESDVKSDGSCPFSLGQERTGSETAALASLVVMLVAATAMFVMVLLLVVIQVMWNRGKLFGLAYERALSFGTIIADCTITVFAVVAVSNVAATILREQKKEPYLFAENGLFTLIPCFSISLVLLTNICPSRIWGVTYWDVDEQDVDNAGSRNKLRQLETVVNAHPSEYVLSNPLVPGVARNAVVFRFSSSRTDSSVEEELRQGSNSPTFPPLASHAYLRRPLSQQSVESNHTVVLVDSLPEGRSQEEERSQTAKTPRTLKSEVSVFGQSDEDSSVE